ncbi:MAG: hypothetical protein JSV43_05860 [Methanobacteriota archaeon]|nr:MAG: hypothetical protein JSV43_05860 [Euryarchaeota archaeon]
MPPFIFDIFFAGMSAEDAWDDVVGGDISGGDPVKFNGRIGEIEQEATPQNPGQLRIEGFDAPVYFNSSENLSAGDEVVVDGIYIDQGFVVGGTYLSLSGQQLYYPVSISPKLVCKGWCEIATWAGVVLIIPGIVMVAFRVKTGEKFEDYARETSREEDDDRDSKKRKRVGWVIGYSEMGIAKIQMEKRTLAVGDKILFKGEETNFSQKLSKMTIGKRIAEEASKGHIIEVEVKKRVRPYDIVFRIV